MYDWRTDFQPYSVEHGLFVAVCAAIMVGTALVGRRLRGSDGGERMRLMVGWFGLAYWIGSNAWWLFGPQYKFAQSLPLQVCDLAGLMGPLALLTRVRWLRAALYFWGLSLSVQGFIQPVLKDKGLMHVEFWLFWANHTVVVGTALYDTIALGFRPRLKDFGVAVVVSMAYLAVIVPFDVMFAVNYGYVGPTDPIPHEPTLADKLGPWPLNAMIMTAIGVLAMWLLYLPWWAARRKGWSNGGDAASRDHFLLHSERMAGVERKDEA